MADETEECIQTLLSSCAHHVESRKEKAGIVVAAEDTDVAVALIALYHDLVVGVEGAIPFIGLQRGKPRAIFDMRRTVARLEALHGENFCPVRDMRGCIRGRLCACGLDECVLVCNCVI